MYSKKNAIFKKYANYYNLLYAEKDYAAEADYLCALLIDKNFSFENKTKLLDIGCGTGRHALCFSKKNFQVTGLDLSLDMIKIAQKSCGAKAGAEKAPLASLRFLVGDARSIRLEEKFDLVSSLFHVASYQTSQRDLSAYFETAYFHLKQGGFFLFDFWHAPGIQKESAAVRVKRFVNDEIQLVRIADPLPNKGMSLLTVNYDIFVKKKQKRLWDHFQESHTMRYWFCEEVEKELRARGFGEISFYGWMRRDSPKESDCYALAQCKKL